MLSAIDTNVISALWSNEPTAQRMAALLQLAHEVGGLVICAPVFAELQAYPGATLPFIERFLSDTDIRVDFTLSEAVWRQASTAFATYAQRRRNAEGGQAKRLLVDFIVGAHALLEADQLLTLDPDRYHKDFPKLTFIASPEAWPKRTRMTFPHDLPKSPK